MKHKTNRWNSQTGLPAPGTNQKEPRCPTENVANNLNLKTKYQFLYGCYDKQNNRALEKYTAARYCLLHRLYDMMRYHDKKDLRQQFVKHKYVLTLLIEQMRSCSALPFNLNQKIMLLQLKNQKNPSIERYRNLIKILEDNRNANVKTGVLTAKRKLIY